MSEQLPTQGGTANTQGRILENTIIPTFAAKRLETVDKVNLKTGRISNFGGLRRTKRALRGFPALLA